MIRYPTGPTQYDAMLDYGSHQWHPPYAPPSAPKIPPLSTHGVTDYHYGGTATKLPAQFPGGMGQYPGMTALPPAGSAAGAFADMPHYAYFKPMDPEEKRRLASEYAGLQVDPHIQSLTKALEQAIADATAQEGRIRGAYAGTETALGRREEAAAGRDLESAIARGAGRAGVVDWQSGQRGEHFSELLAAEKARESAELAAIANQLGLMQRQVPGQIADLEARRGALTSQELQRLQDQQYQRGREYDMDQFARMLGIFDRTMLSPAQQLELYLRFADYAGITPGTTPGWHGRW